MKQPRERHVYYILDEEHHVQPAQLLEWAKWFENSFRDGRRSVAHTRLAGDVLVSTVFLGVDHRFFGNGPPVLFETLVFGGPMDGDMWRYASWDDAEVGHKAAVRRARDAMKG